MKLPLSWLREWVDVSAAPEAIGDALTRRGFYVEGIETHGQSFPGVVVARVLEVNRHPNADRLSLCRVDGGAGELRVVCGASNVRSGMIVPLATVGAKLPGGVEIRKSKIRGEESQGMLCSAKELELSDDHEGIVDLTRIVNGSVVLEPGRPLDEVFGPAETVFEVEVPFNRPDGLGVVGLAREVKAAFQGQWTETARSRFAKRWSGRSDFDLELEDAEGCPRYIAQVIDRVTVGASPRWLVQRLQTVGQRSINAIVDVTNLVLFELGQPLHAFDLDRLGGPSIRVRRAREGEKLVTLDGKERALEPEVLVIADRARPVAIAGVMGGADSEVSASSTRLLLECAWFDPRIVRRGSRRLGLSTEASKRYERGVDPEIGPVAAARFLTLLKEIVPDVTFGPAREKNLTPGGARTLKLRTSRCERLLGRPIFAAEAQRHLEALEFKVAPGDPLRISIPSWRVDVTIEDDLVEEVGRASGYDLVPEKSLESGGLHAVRSPRERIVAQARDAMLARGLSEAMCTSLVSEWEARETSRLLGDENPALVRLANPMSQEHELLRPNLIAGLLRACAHNLRHGNAAVRLFEIGTTVLWNADRPGPGELPAESLMAAAIVTGPRYAHAHSDAAVSAKDSSLGAVEFEDAKGLWEAWLEEMRVDTPEWRSYAAPGWKAGASAEVATGTSRIGWAGTLSPPLLRRWEIDVPVHLFVALLDSLQDATATTRFSSPGRFPPVRRDLAFFVPESLTHLKLERALAAAAGESLTSIELFDLYAGPGTPQGMKSMAYALQFHHPERTLTESEVQAIQDRMVAAVAKDCGGRLRER